MESFSLLRSVFVFLFLVFCFCFKISKPEDTDWIFGTEYRKAATSFFNGGIDGWERDHSGSAFWWGPPWSLDPSGLGFSITLLEKNGPAFTNLCWTHGFVFYFIFIKCFLKRL